MIVACLKWVDQRPEIDALSGAVESDPRTSGASAADQAALELALRAAAELGDGVVAVSAGPPAAEAMLREAVACGAGRAVRVDLPSGAPSEAVAAGLAPVAAGARLVLCGDWSVDRGSGAVPAFLAAHLGAVQALGLAVVTVAAAGDGGLTVLGERRLDGGRRERLRVALPAPATGVGAAVLSVEGAGARLRRASLDAVLRARSAVIEVVPGGPATAGPVSLRVAPYRPRARVLPAPADPSPRLRILELSGALAERTPPATVVLPPAEAADYLLAQLREWGELP